MRDNMTPCYHVFGDGSKILCGVKNPFWKAIVLSNGDVVAWDPTHVGTVAEMRGALPGNMICGRCARIVKSR